MGGDVVVFGGTFDPVHAGHISIADQVLRATDADQVWFMPAGRPALRGTPVAGVDDRLALLRAAVAGRTEFVVRDDEARRDAPSYTVDTMRALRGQHPDVSFSLLIGADAARSMPRWERARDLLRAADFVIVNRAGVKELDDDEAIALGFAPGRRRLLRVESPDISASDVRRRAAAGESLAGLVPPAVERLIAERGLYAAEGRPMHNALG